MQVSSDVCRTAGLEVSRVLIVCIGNELVGDDGAGQAVYHELSKLALHPDVRLDFLGLGGIDLIENLNGEELLIVVDAVQLNGRPGSVHILDWENLPEMVHRPVSGHGIGIREAVAVTQRLYPEKCPSTIYFLGIEGSCYDQLGTGLTLEVARAVPKAVDLILDLIAKYEM